MGWKSMGVLRVFFTPFFGEVFFGGPYITTGRLNQLFSTGPLWIWKSPPTWRFLPRILPWHDAEMFLKKKNVTMDRPIVS